MPLWKTVGMTAALSVVNLNVATCRSPAEEPSGDPPPKEATKVVEIEGIDTSNLTPREKKDWSSYVSELLAPCADQPVSVAQCVREKRKCSRCAPAARFLVTQVSRGRTRSQVEAAYRTRFSDEAVKEIELGDSPAKGAKDPAVTIVEWADFECPFCGAASPVLDKTVLKFPDHVKLVFKHYPLSSHEHAEGAARAAAAAGKQQKFWEMHRTLFAAQAEGLDRRNLERHARKLGLDMKQFLADVDSEPVADLVARDRKHAEKLGLRGTPMIYVNGRHFELDHFNLIEDLDDWIQLEILERTGKKVDPKKIASDAAADGDPAQ